MSRSQDRGCYYSRWSEPLLRRRYSMHLVRTSEEESSSVWRSRSSSPFLNALRPPMPLSEPPGCCSCHVSRCIRKKSSKSQSANRPKKSNGIHQQMRESLEIQLVGSQVEEALAADKLSGLIQHLEISTDALEALIQHVRSLQVSHLSAQRVVNLANQLILPRSMSTDLATRLRQVESHMENRLCLLKETVDDCFKNVTVSRQAQSLMDDHKTKKEDFEKAARNFKNLLENSKLTISQMDKLQWQYQAIMDDYKENRRALDSVLPKIIKIRLGSIRQGISMVAAFYEDIEYSKQIADLLKIFGETLCQEESGTENGDSNLHGKSQSLQLQEICQKCKVNRVDKK